MTIVVVDDRLDEGGGLGANLWLPYPCLFRAERLGDLSRPAL